MNAMTYSAPRERAWNGGLYVIRDVWSGKRFQTCEYAVPAGDGVEWRPCREAVDFAEIQPLRRVDG